MSGKQNTSRLTESMIREIEEIVNDPMFPEQPTARNETTPGMYLSFLLKINIKTQD